MWIAGNVVDETEAESWMWKALSARPKCGLLTWSHNASLLEEVKYNWLVLQGDCEDQTGKCFITCRVVHGVWLKLALDFS